MRKTQLRHKIEAFRRFNRFYTRRIGILNRLMLGTPFHLNQARVLYEIARFGETTASDLAVDLDMDAGYLSRMLAGMEKDGLVRRSRSKADGRQRLVTLTPKGMKGVALINAEAKQQATAILGGVSDEDQERLLVAFRCIEDILGAEPE